MKHKSNRPDIKIRELPPRTTEKNGEVQILCPFCEPPHPIAVGREAACGTLLKVTAVQVLIPSRTVNRDKLICVKCHKGGGEMVKYHQGYVHLHECTPHTKLMTEPPPFSRLAGVLYGLPSPIRNPVEKYLGKWIGTAKQVKEVDPSGNDTGKVLGYFFYKPGGSNATH